MLAVPALVLIVASVSLAAGKRFFAIEDELNLSLPLKKCWEYKLSQPNYADTNAASDNSKGFLIFNDAGQLRLLDTTAVKLVWSSDLVGTVESNIAADDSTIYFVSGREKESNGGARSRTLKSVDKTTGLLRRQIALPDSGRDGGMVFVTIFGDEKILVVGGDGANGYALAFDKKDGGELWSRRFSGEPTAVAGAVGGMIAVAARDRKIFSVSIDGTEVNAPVDARGDVTALAATSNRRFIYGDKTGFVYAPNVPNALPAGWRFRAGAQVNDITETVYGMLVSSNDNFLYLLKPGSGKLVWRRRLAGRISGKPLVTGAFAVVSGSFQSEVAVVDLKTGRIVNRIFLDDDDYPNGSMFVRNTQLIIPTVKEINGFSSNGCK